MKITKKSREDGTIEYRNEQGKLHREDGPAYIGADGTELWYLNSNRIPHTSSEFILFNWKILSVIIVYVVCVVGGFSIFT